MPHVEPRMLPRLDEIEADLNARRHRAESEGWRGEIEGHRGDPRPPTLPAGADTPHPPQRTGHAADAGGPQPVQRLRSCDAGRYRLVVAIDSCPHHSCTVARSTPRASQRHAAVCRRKCERGSALGVPRPGASRRRSARRVCKPECCMSPGSNRACGYWRSGPAVVSRAAQPRFEVASFASCHIS
jgi:hypothetical protein